MRASLAATGGSWILAVLAAAGIYPALGSSLSHQHPLQSAAGSRAPRRCRGAEITARYFDQQKALPAAPARPGLGIRQHSDPACQRVQRQHDLITQIRCLDQTLSPCSVLNFPISPNVFQQGRPRGSQQNPPQSNSLQLLQNCAALFASWHFHVFHHTSCFIELLKLIDVGRHQPVPSASMKEEIYHVQSSQVCCPDAEDFKNKRMNLLRKSRIYSVLQHCSNQGGQSG